MPEGREGYRRGPECGKIHDAVGNATASADVGAAAQAVPAPDSQAGSIEEEGADESGGDGTDVA